jgi:membrane dipeptidase
MRMINELSRSEEEKALDIYRKSTVVNACDSTYALKTSYCMSDEYVNEMLQAGVTAGVGTLAYHPTQGFRFAIEFISDTYAYRHRDSKLKVAFKAEDIKKAKKEGRVLLIVGTQNAAPIESDIGLLSILHKLGLRVLGLTYNYRNLLGDGCLEKANSGLSAYGLQVIEEMHRLGIVMDLTHVGEKTSLDAMKASKDPVLFTHSGARGLRKHWRNISDEEIKACAETGGVVGIPTLPLIVKDPASGPVSIEDALDHFEYIIKLVGVDHVGFGLDVSGGPGKPIENPSKIPELQAEIDKAPAPPILKNMNDIRNIAKGLVARGYADQEITKVLGGNFLRVFERVWK